MLNMRTVLLAIVLLCLDFSLSAETITLLDGANTLRFIDSAAPVVTLRSLTVTGLHELLAIDYRPATGELYGFAATAPASNAVRVYRIDTTTGVATQISVAGFTRFTSPDVGMDFDPVADILRITDGSANLTIDPDDGEDEHYHAWVGPIPPSALAYSNNFSGASTTTLYALTYPTPNVLRLVTMGSPGGTPVSPNDSVQFPVGGSVLPNSSGATTGLDISANGTAYATLGSPARLYIVNLSNGAITLVGGLPTSTIRDLAVGGIAPAFHNEPIPTLSPLTLVLLAFAVGVTAVFALRS